jgi:hypothetical protein
MLRGAGLVQLLAQLAMDFPLWCSRSPGQLVGERAKQSAIERCLFTHELEESIVDPCRRVD